MLNWRIYYDNGSTFDCTEGSPLDAPYDGVLCIVQPDILVGRCIMHGWDWYYYVPSEEQWWGSDIFGLIDQFKRHSVDTIAVKQGANVTNAAFMQVMHDAAEDKDFLPKTAIAKYESPLPMNGGSPLAGILESLNQRDDNGT